MNLFTKKLLAPAFFCVALHSSYGQNMYAVKNVSVIPMTEEVVLKNKTVIVENGKIKLIADNGTEIPETAIEIDGTGKFLAPGLFDMHGHFFQEQYDQHESTTDTELKMMLANGLTTVRIMAGHPAYLEAKANVQDGKWTGPSLVVASPQFVGSWPWPPEFKNYEVVDTKEKAVAAVKKCKEEGYDAIKITFMISAEVYNVIVTTAKEEGLRVVGHVGPKVKLPAALAAGEQVEHMDEFIDQLLPDTSYNHGQSVSDMNIWRKPAWATVPFLDESKIPSLADAVKRAGIYVTPTNYFFISTFAITASEEETRKKRDYNYIPRSLIAERWKNRQYWIDIAIPQASRDKYVRIRKKMLYELWKAGVPLMTGSDSPEFFLVAGFSLHDELASFVEAGLTPFAALQAATVNPAKYLAMTDRGTLETGKTADMILLDKNPLTNIHNTTAIAGVFKSGVWYDRVRIKTMLEDAAKLFSQ